MGAFTGAWISRYQAPPEAALKPGTDPEHLDPTTAVDRTPTRWVSTVDSPGLPGAVLPDTDPYGLSIGMSPVDETPISHEFGVGVGAGLTVDESRARMGPWHETDLGSYAATHNVPAIDRDGSPHVAITVQSPEYGDSPETLQYQRTGVGQPTDPGARMSRRIQRWYDRRIDMHRGEVVPQAVGPKYAKTPPKRSAVGTGAGPTVSPFANSVAYQAGSPDNFVAPQVRRIPEPWDAATADDGSGSALSGAPTSYGLHPWGV